ncbi:MAG: hypothetical protein QXI61_05735, partial [Nitrososphaerota archaeon]
MNEKELFELLGITPEEITTPSSGGETQASDTYFVLTNSEINECPIEAQDKLAISDFYYAFYKYLLVKTNCCKDKKRATFLDVLTSSIEFKQLRELTVGDRHSSEIIAKTLYDHFTKSTSDNLEHQDITASAMLSVKAIEDEMNMIQDGIMPSFGPGVAGQPLKNHLIRTVFDKIKNNEELRRIIEMAGKFHRMSKSAQETKTIHGYDDMIGVTLDCEVGRLISSELLLLAEETYELDVLRRIVERQAMCKEYVRIEQQCKGPIVVVVDESGSMTYDDRVYKAKALALAMIWVAIHQKRWIALIGYSGGMAPNLLVLKHNESKENELLSWLEHFYGGGSELDLPINELPEIWSEIKFPAGKTDLIFITDAIINPDKATMNKFKAWKADNQVSCISI